MIVDPPLPQPLRRAREGRWLGGVCQGVAARWAIPVAQVRGLFALAVLLGGLGALAYAACWLVLPAEGEQDSPSAVRGLASLALVAASCAGLATLAVAAGTATLFGFGWAVAVALGAFLVGALVAWPLVRPAWVLLPLAAVALPAVAVAASGVRIEPQAGVVLAAPRAVAEIPADGYRAGLGDLLVDLRGLDAPPGAEIPLRIDTGVGETVVALPHDRCFDVDVRYRSGTAVAGLGARLLELWRPSWIPGWTPIFLFGEQQSSRVGHWRREGEDPRAPRLRIDFTSVDGGLTVRDYPDSVGPLFDPIWPQNVHPPASPGARRWAWRIENHAPAVQRKWREWRRRERDFRRHFARLLAGPCGREAAR